MRKQLYILFLLSLFIVLPAKVCAAESVQAVVEKAEKAYELQQYSASSEMLEQLLAAQPEVNNFAICYNLGNSYYRQGKLGKAILNYERALRYKPNDKETKHNLLLANSQTVDRFDYTPSLTKSVWRAIAYTPTATLSIVLALAFAITMVAALLLFLLSVSRKRRQVGFYTALIALFLTIFSLCILRTRRRDFFDRSEAVIIVGKSMLHASPNEAANSIQAISEGAKITIKDQNDSWCLIETPDGKSGWLHKEHLETITQ